MLYLYFMEAGFIMPVFMAEDTEGHMALSHVSLLRPHDKQTVSHTPLSLLCNSAVTIT